MIVRILAVDPRPRDKARDVVVYQVPEHSREFELLTELFEREGISWTTIESNKVRRKKGG